MVEKESFERLPDYLVRNELRHEAEAWRWFWQRAVEAFEKQWKKRNETRH